MGVLSPAEGGLKGHLCIAKTTTLMALVITSFVAFFGLLFWQAGKMNDAAEKRQEKGLS